MDKYCVTGMSCAACSSRVESAVRKLNNVDEVSVNLLTNSMTVIGTAKPEEVIRAVENAGYGAFIDDKNLKESKGACDKTMDENRFSYAFLVDQLCVTLLDFCLTTSPNQVVSQSFFSDKLNHNI